jgi:hypothetical protein
MATTRKKSQEAKELTAAALLVLAQRIEGKITKLTRAVDSLKKRAKAALKGKSAKT